MTQLNPYQRYLETRKNKGTYIAPAPAKNNNTFTNPVAPKVPETTFEEKTPDEVGFENTEEAAGDDPDSLDFSSRKRVKR